MRVVLAPDKFKGSATAAEVCDWLARGIRRRAPDAQIVSVPVADGGDGTVAAAITAGFSPVPAVVSGPTGDPVEAVWARRGDDAVVELANTCGLALLAGPPGPESALAAHTAGLGEAIAAALSAGCRRIVVGIGGSASTDGGGGLISALGGGLLAQDGHRVPPGGGALPRVAGLDLRGLHPALREADLVVASDVDNPLCGPRGAASVYGPQKGAGPAEVAALDAALAHWADVVAASTGADRRDEPGTGAAGGAGFGLVAVLGARLAPGFELLTDLFGLRDALRGADLVVTGEGALDQQTLFGKAPAGVAVAARASRVPVVAVAGHASVRTGFDAVYALTDLEPDVARSIADPGPLLERSGERIADDWMTR